MERELLRMIGRERAEEKQLVRDRDAARLASGEVSAAELQAENHFFRALDLTSFRISAIGAHEIRPAA